jgi:PEP-CTERM motif
MNPRLPLRALVGALLLTLPFAAAARGELITVQFIGTVTSVNRQQLEGFDLPDVGEPLTGFYKFDSTAQDLLASAPDHGLFGTFLPARAVVVSIGDFTFEGPSSRIDTFQDHYLVSEDYLELTSNPAIAQILRGFNSFNLHVRKDNLFSDPNTLPLSPPSLDGALQRQMFLGMNVRIPGPPSPDQVTIVASLDSLTVVPEPSSLLLLGIASILSLQNRIVP